MQTQTSCQTGLNFCGNPVKVKAYTVFNSYTRLGDCRHDQVGSVCTAQYQAQEKRHLTIFYS